MRIGMVEAVAEDHFEIHIGAALGKLAEIFAGLLQRFNIHADDAFEVLHRHDLMGAKIAEDLGNAHSRVVGEVAAKLLLILPLVGEVELAQQRAAELAHHGEWLVGSQSRRMRLQQFRECLHDLHISRGLFGHASTAHFDHHALAGVQQCGMNLRDGGGGERFVLETGKELLNGQAEFFFNRGACHAGGVGRHVGLQLGEFLGQLGAEQISARAEHLTELDKGGAKFRQRHAHPGRLRHALSERLSIRAFEPVLQPGVFETAEQVRQSVFAEHGGDFRDALCVTFESGQGVDLHGEDE